MQVTIVTLAFTANRDAWDDVPLHQSEQNADYRRRRHEPQYENIP